MLRTSLLLAVSLAGVLSGVCGEPDKAVIDGREYEIKYLEAADDGAGFRYRDITTTAGGELEKLLGGDLTTIDSLVVRGPVNDADFRTMWLSTYTGRTTVINLENAVVENGILPAGAFWRNEQINIEDGVYYSVKLRKIILPEGLREIGEWAFFCSMKLVDVNFPSTLKSIGECAFHWCRSLWWDTLAFPEGLEEIGESAFREAYHICDNVILPSTLRTVGDLAFYAVRIKNITIHEGLETIGNGAFASTVLKELVLPESCVNLSTEKSPYNGSGALHSNFELEKLHLSDNITTIPYNFAKECFSLKEVNIPKSVKTIERGAFLNCDQIETIDLPEGLDSIKVNAFRNCGAHTKIVFPSTLRFLGSESCAGWTSCREIYCKSAVPPVCERNNKKYPFGTYEEPNWNAARNGCDLPHTGPEITLYVPKGSVDSYRFSFGWDSFYHIVGLDPADFPAGIDDVEADSRGGDTTIYDLSGRAIGAPAAGQIYIKDGKKFINR